MQIPAEDMMPTWEEDYIYLFLKANSTQNLFLAVSSK